MVTFQAAAAQTEARLKTGDASPPPVVRGISIETKASANAADVETALQAATATVQSAASSDFRARLGGLIWEVRPVPGLENWFDAMPNRELPLGVAWEFVYALRRIDIVRDAEPLLFVSQKLQEASAEDEPELRRFAAFEAWGRPYFGTVRKAINEAAKDPVWHLKMLRAIKAKDSDADTRAAWNIWKAKAGFEGKLPGAGIAVGHPDTGYTDHPLLKGKLRDQADTEPAQNQTAFGKNFLEHESDQSGRDPVHGIPIVDQPGHGTTTASLIVGGDWDDVSNSNDGAVGVAPGASVIPLRVSSRVVHFDFRNVRDAIVEAADRGADVISMSLGGPVPNRGIQAAVQYAVSKGVIVCCAAGNLVPTTVFPAAFPESFAIGGVNALGLGWEGSSGGNPVDISAPGSQVRHATAEAKNKEIDFQVKPGWGTSFATALTAGTAALWVSFHGGSTKPGEARKNLAAKYGDDVGLIPYAFAAHQKKCAFVLDNTGKDWEDETWDSSHYGAGIVDAAKLLSTALPTRDEVVTYRDKELRRPTSLLGRIVNFVLGRSVGTVTPQQEAEITGIAQELLGSDAEDLLGELVTRVVSDFRLLAAFLAYAAERQSSGNASPYLLLDLILRLYGTNKPGELSTRLRTTIEIRMAAVAAELSRTHRAVANKPAPTNVPGYRRLRVFAADPSLQTRLATAAINTVTLPILWEPGLRPGPIGEYLEVVDVDPASACVYAPVNLDDPKLLATDGLSPSEGDPQFHQQMVYSVAMNTISHFERALGRPVFWSCVSPWRDDLPQEKDRYTADEERSGSPGRPGRDEGDRYIARLRIYPHALREANAFYSPSKRALLFGYFPATRDDTGKFLPGGLVFTCLSNDIVAHETTHAILDGLHTYFNEPTNRDVLAFHEAFADIVALFQRFTYVEFLRHQIAAARGDLAGETLLGQLAQEFGLAVGGRNALRTYLGERRMDADGVERWHAKEPNPSLLPRTKESHLRGAILVAALFRAFLIVYNYRTADLLRLYTGGTGVLPAGQIHPDLVNRLADEAARAASDVLAVCIRAMDYVPPVDITFGEYLRALITADYVRDQSDERYRVAFIEAFRAWGIYPEEMQALSTQSLRWRTVQEEAEEGKHPLDTLMQHFHYANAKNPNNALRNDLLSAVEQWKPGSPRKDIFRLTRIAQASLHKALKTLNQKSDGEEILPGLDLSPDSTFHVANLRVLRRILPDGAYQSQMVFEVIQTYHPELDNNNKPVANPNPGGLPLRGGSTVIVNLQTGKVEYVIYKRLYQHDAEGNALPNVKRQIRQSNFLNNLEPALSLSSGETTSSTASETIVEETGVGLGTHLESMFDSTCACTRRRTNVALLSEPFALLHRGIAVVEADRDVPPASDNAKETNNGRR